MEKRCQQCKEMFIDSSPSHLKKWCSADCKKIHRNLSVRKHPISIEKKCHICGMVIHDISNHKRQKFCSLRCYDKSKNKNPSILEKICLNCGITFNDATYGKNKEFCSILCKKSSINNKLIHSLRSRLNHALKRGFKAGSAVRDLGCSIEELKKHLESKWHPHPETGELMTWNNHALRGWHIDHIKPLDSFDLSNREQLKIACHYTNLQPLWWRDNIIKGVTYVKE
jgi:endogenous inhibitor of DNA gyrase (YacG/DUF329 family)